VTFEQLNLIPPLLRALQEKGYNAPTPIQRQSIPAALQGRDVLGCAQTGTGKTAAFALPILQRMWDVKHTRAHRPVLALVLAPTRELASQIGESFAQYGKHSHLRAAVIFGGVGYPKQREALKRGVDIVVATPGRLLDLMGERAVNFEHLQILVLDEADRMLDMGFLPDVKRVLSALPKKRQTLFFSATMPTEIQRLVASLLQNPLRVEVAPQATTAEKVEQSVYFVEGKDKPAFLANLLSDAAVTRALVFTRTKRGADRVAKRLKQDGIPAEAIHGNKSQNARERALAGFKSGRGLVLVATDIAARGIDVRDISHVINYELPNEPETYVHRIGRTARAEKSGTAWSLCSSAEREYLSDIERLIRTRIPVAGRASRGGAAERAPGEHARAAGRPPRRVEVPGAHGRRPEATVAAAPRSADAAVAHAGGGQPRSAQPARHGGPARHAPGRDGGGRHGSHRAAAHHGPVRPGPARHGADRRGAERPVPAAGERPQPALAPRRPLAARPGPALPKPVRGHTHDFGAMLD
jgi:ATP-dependent RNA helicase RhlE